MGEVWRATDTSLGRAVAVKVLKSEYADDPTVPLPVRDRGPARRVAAPPGRRVGLRRRGVRAARRGRRLRPAAAVPRDGARRRAAALGAAARRPAARPRGGPRPDGPGRRRDRRRAPGRHRAPRREAGQPAGHARPADEDHRLRHRPRLRRPRPDRHRPGDGHAAVPLPRAGPRRHRDVRPPTSTRSASWRSSAWPGIGPSTPTRRSRPPCRISTTRCRTCPPDVPADLAAVVRRAMAKEPEQRYADGDAFAAALRDPAGAAATAYVPLPALVRRAHPGPRRAAGAAGAGGRSRRRPTDDRRSPWLVVLLVLALVAAIILIIVVATTGERRRRRPDRVRHQQRADVVGADHRGHPERGVELRAGRGADQRGRLRRPQRRRGRDRAARQGARGRHPAGRQPR